MTGRRTEQDAPRSEDPPGMISWLWGRFVLAWLVALVITAILLARNPETGPRLPAAFILLTFLGATYLWLCFREGIGPEDLEPGGPGGRILGRRLFWLALMLAQVGGLVALVPHAGAWWLVMHVVVAAGLSLPPVAALGVIVLLTGAAFTVAARVGPEADPMLFINVAFGAGAIAIRQLTLNLTHLREAREALAHWAVDQERLRFARDLHDLLGHGLSVIVLKSELAGRLLPADPGRAAAEIGDVELAAREALRQVRATVAGYRQPSLDREFASARELLAAAGVGVGIERQVGALAPEADALMAWAVREGVINVIRHGRAQRCEIVLAPAEVGVLLTISDDGRGAAADGTPPGSGLAGLKERAAACGATVRAGPLPGGGFRLAVEAPQAAIQEAP